MGCVCSCFRLSLQVYSMAYWPLIFGNDGNTCISNTCWMSFGIRCRNAQLNRPSNGLCLFMLLTFATDLFQAYWPITFGNGGNLCLLSTCWMSVGVRCHNAQIEPILKRAVSVHVLAICYRSILGAWVSSLAMSAHLRLSSS